MTSMSTGSASNKAINEIVENSHLADNDSSNSSLLNGMREMNSTLEYGGLAGGIGGDIGSIGVDSDRLRSPRTLGGNIEDDNVNYTQAKGFLPSNVSQHTQQAHSQTHLMQSSQSQASMLQHQYLSNKSAPTSSASGNNLGSLSGGNINNISIQNNNIGQTSNLTPNSSIQRLYENGGGGGGSSSSSGSGSYSGTSSTPVMANSLLSSNGNMIMMNPGDDDEDDSDLDESSGGRGRRGDKRAGRRKIRIEYIDDKSRRHITFSKRKAGIMKKAYELSTLTGTQVLLLVASETGHVYTFATPKLQPLITKPEGKNLIQACLNAPDMHLANNSSHSTASALTHGGGGIGNIAEYSNAIGNGVGRDNNGGGGGGGGGPSGVFDNSDEISSSLGVVNESNNQPGIYDDRNGSAAGLSVNYVAAMAGLAGFPYLSTSQGGIVNGGGGGGSNGSGGGGSGVGHHQHGSSGSGNPGSFLNSQHYQNYVNTGQYNGSPMSSGYWPQSSANSSQMHHSIHDASLQADINVNSNRLNNIQGSLGSNNMTNIHHG